MYPRKSMDQFGFGRLNIQSQNNMMQSNGMMRKMIDPMAVEIDRIKRRLGGVQRPQFKTASMGIRG